MRRSSKVLLLLGLLLALGRNLDAAAPESSADAFRLNRALGRGVNLGNVLEAPKEGAWGLKLEAGFFATIKEAGFNSVRVPIKWSIHAESAAPYTIDAAFFERVDWVVDQALKNQLAVMIDVHHYDEMFTAPVEHLPRLLGIWRQIAERYRDRPEQVYFELLNEPHGKLNDEIWNAMIPQLIEVIRPSNPSRAIVVGPAEWNGIWKLKSLHLPKQDQGLIVTVHYYSPNEFTHQGASWTKGSEKWLGRTWTGSPAEQQTMDKDFETASTWAQKEHRPIFVGEFGVYSKAAMESRVRWTQHVVAEAERAHFSWCYWEFAAGFGVYDPKEHAWREPLLHALIKPKP